MFCFFYIVMSPFSGCGGRNEVLGLLRRLFDLECPSALLFSATKR